MVTFQEKKLSNGLTVITHYDKSSPLAIVNVLYKVGSRNEQAKQTGMAHLFEHLMFSGSKHVEDFDLPLQEVGGENNAFTNCDITNYYDIVPAENIETALWLESDRMKFLDLSDKNVDIQKKVVIEEFGETCLNRPYGDLWHHVSDLCYQKYPYKWPTIGYTPEHVESISKANALDFYEQFYEPSNATIAITGNISNDKAFDLVNKWFGDFDSNHEVKSLESDEPDQTAKRSRTVYGNVPTASIMMAFPMHQRIHPDYYAHDLLSDVLGYGKTSRFYKKYVIDQAIFTSVNIYITGTHGPGLFIIEAKPAEGVSIDQCRETIWNELELLKKEGVTDYELQKIKNSLVSHMAFSETSILNKAMSLAYFDSIGSTQLINDQMAAYAKVSTDQMLRISRSLFTEQKTNEIIYLPIEQKG